MKNVLKCVAFAALAAGFVLGASAADAVEYLEPVYVGGVATNGIDHWVTNSVSDYTVVASSDERVEWGTAGETKWYVVTNNVTLSRGVDVKGDVRLILVDGAKLTINEMDYYEVNERAAITVSGDGNAFTIYGQTAGTGKLDIESNEAGAGIGGEFESPGSNITINGGTVTVTCPENGMASGIGAGQCGEGETDVTINGGTVTVMMGAWCSDNAGIGGTAGNGATRITINGGMVTSAGGDQGAGIGGSYMGSVTSILINGGTIIATGGKSGAGIGASEGCDVKNVTINGGTITAEGGLSDGYHPAGSGIGGSTVYVANGVLLKADNNNPPTTVIEHASITTDVSSSLKGRRYATAEVAPPTGIEYLVPVYVGGVVTNGIDHWVTNTVSDFSVVTSATRAVTWGTAGATNWYVVTNGTFQIDGGVICAGHVNLLLCEGAKLTVTNTVATWVAGIATDKNGSFTIYGQPDGAGALEARGGVNSAGIGSDNVGNDGSNITINGGDVTAIGGTAGAGIGGGLGKSGHDIAINGGTVTANGGRSGAGIGGGYQGAGSNITINGGEIHAWGGSGGSGIGGGYEGEGLNIAINGGVVNSTSDSWAAGIGGGSHSIGSNIVITAGIVTAQGGYCSAGIGGGSALIMEAEQIDKRGVGTAITISGGRVTAIGGAGGAAIGGGCQAKGMHITIDNAKVAVGGPGLTPGGDVIDLQDLIGNGMICTNAAEDVTISDSAQVLFNVSGIDKVTWDQIGQSNVVEVVEPRAPMPEDFSGLVILTPETLLTNRVLVGGCANWTASTTFALTNGVTGATDSIVVNDAAGTHFAGADLTLPHANNTLMLAKKTVVAANFISFTAASGAVTLGTASGKGWNGTMYASTNSTDWFEWNGETIVSQGSEIRVYGSGNTVVSYNGGSKPWTLAGSQIAAEGDIAALLDGVQAAKGIESAAAPCAFDGLFKDCTSLVQAPTLSLKNCGGNYFYRSMFSGCTALTAAPEIALTNTAIECCSGMFESCSALKTAPSELSALSVASSGYASMFARCSALTNAPVLAATNLGEAAYLGMFDLCTSLKVAPALPSVQLANSVYYQMFRGCTSLTRVPTLPATNLTEHCYQEMFPGCRFTLYSPGVGESWSIPEEAVTASYWNADMFDGNNPPFPGGAPMPGVKYYYAPWPNVTFTPTAVANTTAVVYTNDVAMAVAASYAIPSNATPVVVVYTAANGYCFAGGVTTITNAIDATKNPATADAPTAPFEAVASVTTNGVTTVYDNIHDAWGAAKTGTKTVPATMKLLKDASLMYTLQAGYTTVVTVDLNGKTLTGESMSSDGPIFQGNEQNDDFSDLTIMNGTLTGAKGSAISAPTAVKLTLDHIVLTGNSAKNGGAINVGLQSQILVKDCVITNNTASENGGAIWTQMDSALKCVLVRTLITDNRAGSNGGGVYFYGKSCFAAGTRIRLADGSETAIENVKEGDVIATFDHEGGTNSTARVYYAYKSAGKAVPFTLQFDTPLSLSIVGCHDLLLKDTRKYVTITGQNVGQYIGAKFYGADGAWHTLTNVTMGTEAIEYYSLYTAQHQNVYANGLLTVADDVDYLLNIYELDENLKADAAQLAADLAQYGVISYDEAATYGVSRDWYDDAGMKYLYVAIGKQFVSREYVEQLFASTGRAAKPLAAAPKMMMAAAPLLATASGDPTLDDAVAGCLTLGENVIITNNFVEEAANNVYLDKLDNLPLIALAASHDGINVGVTRSDDTGQFTTTDNVSASDVALFTSDRYPQSFVRYNASGYLELAASVQVGDDAWAQLADGLCTVVGTGDMWNTNSWPSGSNPLAAYKKTITNVVVASGVTSVGSQFFQGFWSLQDVSLSSSVTNIGTRAFKKCFCLTNVTSLATGSVALSDYAFVSCNSLEKMSFAGNPTFGTQSYTLMAGIYMKDGGIPVVYTIPEITTEGLSQHLMGKKSLADEYWTDVTSLTDEERKEYHFFKVEVK